MASKSTAEELLDLVQDLCFHLPAWAAPVIALLAGGGTAGLLTYLYNSGFEKYLAPESASGLILLAGGIVFLLTLIAGLSGSLKRGAHKRKLAETKSIENLRSLSWWEFEALVAEYYRQNGYTVLASGGPKADGGIDLVATDSSGARHLVQCKHWKQQRVGVSIVREMLGVLTKEQASTTKIVCTGSFTKEAIDFAAGEPIELIDGHQLIAMIHPDRVTEQSVAAKEEPLICPECGCELVERLARRGPNAGNTFIGCTAFPKCRYTR